MATQCRFSPNELARASVAFLRCGNKNLDALRRNDQSLVGLPALQLLTKFVLSSPVSFLSEARLEQDREIDCVDDPLASAALGLMVAGKDAFVGVDTGASLAADDASSAVFGGGGACARATAAINTATVRRNAFAFILSKISRHVPDLKRRGTFAS
jgi:hypothetical protein